MFERVMQPKRLSQKMNRRHLIKINLLYRYCGLYGIIAHMVKVLSIHLKMCFTFVFPALSFFSSIAVIVTTLLLSVSALFLSYNLIFSQK